MILVDSSVWIGFLRSESTPSSRTLRALIEQEEDLCVTGIVITEILQGIRDDRLSKEMQRYLLGFPLYEPQGVLTYIKAADIFKACARQGMTVRKTVDCLIAAVCIENGLALLHSDRDFESISACTELAIVDLGP